MYVVENSEGDWLHSDPDLDVAVDYARSLLEDDPERGELTVALHRIERTVTFGPDANWETQVVVLKPGEKIAPPDGSWRGFLDTLTIPENSCHRSNAAWQPSDETGYDLNDPKSPGFHDRMSEIWDNRDKTAGGRTF